MKSNTHAHTWSRTHTQTYTNYIVTVHTQNPGGPPGTGPEFNNCKALHSTLQLSWRLDYTNSRVQFRLCGCTATTSKYD